MADGWYYAVGGDRKGPVEEAALRALTDAGVVQPDTLVWREGMADWEPAFRHVPGLAPRAPRASNVRSYPGAPAYAATGRDYHEQVGMGEAFRRFWSNYVAFSGRSNRGEYWWATLANVLISIALAVLDAMIFGVGPDSVGVLGGLFGLAALLPGLAIGVRRLHDIDRTGWWLLIGLVPLVGAIVLIVFFATRGENAPNRFG